MKNFVSWTIVAALFLLSTPMLAVASSPENWVVIAAGTGGGVGYSQGGNKTAVKSRVLAQCEAGNGNDGECGVAWGKTGAFLVVIECPVSASETFTWGWSSYTTLVDAREGALSRMKNRINAHGYLTRAQDCVDRITYGNGKIWLP